MKTDPKVYTMNNSTLEETNSYKRVVPFIFLLSIILFWAHYTVGTYDLGEDLWNRANYLASFSNSDSFANDYLYCTTISKHV